MGETIIRENQCDLERIVFAEQNGVLSENLSLSVFIRVIRGKNCSVGLTNAAG